MINKDFFMALEDLEREKGISQDVFIKALESALTAAYKKAYGEAKNAMVVLSPEKNTIRIFSFKTVVEELENPDKEVTLEEAREEKKSYKVGDIIKVEESTKDFGRIAAQTAKQVVMQKLKEIEKEKSISELAEKEDALIKGIVKRIDNDTVFINLPGSTVEGTLMPNDQIPGEHYKIGEQIKVYVKKINDSFRGTSVQVSRTHIAFVKKLFELEVPEIVSGDIVIKNIARDPGNRTKVALWSANPNIDPVGTCVGVRGARIAAIMEELGNEKIDLIPYSEDPLEYIAASLSPATVLSVEINESLKTSQVIVPDDKLSLAIGKSGQNVRLAARLTGWKIDVRKSSLAEAAKNEEVVMQDYEITEIEDNADVNFDEFEDITE